MNASFHNLANLSELITQPAITYSKLTIETLEQGVNYVQSLQENTRTAPLFLLLTLNM